LPLAADVVKFNKWEEAEEDYRFITIGQHGHTEIVAAASQHINPNYFLLGPEVVDVSPATVSVLVYSI